MKGTLWCCHLFLFAAPFFFFPVRSDLTFVGRLDATETSAIAAMGIVYAAGMPLDLATFPFPFPVGGSQDVIFRLSEEEEMICAAFLTSADAYASNRTSSLSIPSPAYLAMRAFGLSQGAIAVAEDMEGSITYYFGQPGVHNVTGTGDASFVCYPFSSLEEAETEGVGPDRLYQTPVKTMSTAIITSKGKSSLSVMGGPPSERSWNGTVTVFPYVKSSTVLQPKKGKAQALFIDDSYIDSSQYSPFLSGKVRVVSRLELRGYVYNCSHPAHLACEECVQARRRLPVFSKGAAVGVEVTDFSNARCCSGHGKIEVEHGCVCEEGWRGDVCDMQTQIGTLSSSEREEGGTSEQLENSEEIMHDESTDVSIAYEEEVRMSEDEEAGSCDSEHCAYEKYEEIPKDPPRFSVSTSALFSSFSSSSPPSSSPLASRLSLAVSSSSSISYTSSPPSFSAASDHIQSPLSFSSSQHDDTEESEEENEIESKEEGKQGYMSSTLQFASSDLEVNGNTNEDSDGEGGNITCLSSDICRGERVSQYISSDVNSSEGVGEDKRGEDSDAYIDDDIVEDWINFNINVPDVYEERRAVHRRMTEESLAYIIILTSAGLLFIFLVVIGIVMKKVGDRSTGDDR
mmetsp:Transcript_5700/g.13336  ORF Transcript_5700/g.13336 Transcript_5700/m.13336 type:complete len:628 (-) Transcript_5700:12-1895(-)